MARGHHGMVPDLLWDDVKNFFDPDLMGSLPDVSVADTSVDDWQAVFDLVRSRGWACEYSEDGAVLRLPRAGVMLARGGEASVMVRVWPVPGVEAIFRPYAAESIDFDVDLRQLQGQVQLNVLCGFLRAIGRRLSKPVSFAPEMDSGHPVLGFDVDADRVVLLADPHFSRS
ncbi:hypothetical protein OOK58_42475 [Streptomyces sp. NBC_01728]|uniref:hypothetical protein n=1 Tax=unclassified Streptomyces TaxID=2593676 RepID=UPI0022577133|nr:MULTISPECIES: hypothetical protein [unclassified Streptomyces]MCX4458579.1 hypothetical protein [Streptomyces sp. NBC_01719]MCX4497936.1 hypothetical protein [Streptomyces sp. NBC_01728]